MKQETAIFETGATSAAVNELILYTDNDAELAKLRDATYTRILNEKKIPNPNIFIRLLDTAQSKYFWEFEKNEETIHIYEMHQVHFNEYCQIYANRFADWKRERELQAKQK